MAREWILHYSHYPRGQLPGIRGRKRQRKLDALERSKLQNVVESLPILLQLSLQLFFAGLVDYLYAVNRTVSLVVLVFALAGLGVYIGSFLFAAVDPSWPYQSSSSIFTHTFLDLVWRVSRVAYDFLQRDWKRPKYGPAPNPANPDSTAQGEPPGRTVISSNVQDEPSTTQSQTAEEDPIRKDEDDRIDTRTACWVIETSGDEKALLPAARNIPSLRKIASTDLSVEGVAFYRLFYLFTEALSAWRATSGLRNPDSSSTAMVYGRALCHTVIGSTRDSKGIKLREQAQDIQWPRWRKDGPAFSANEFILMKICIRGWIAQDFCLNDRETTMPDLSSALPIYIAALVEPDIRKKDFRISGPRSDRITLLQWLITACLKGSQEAPAPSAINLCAWVLGELPELFENADSYFDDQLRRRWWDAYTRYASHTVAWKTLTDRHDVAISTFIRISSRHSRCITITGSFLPARKPTVPRVVP